MPTAPPKFCAEFGCAERVSAGRCTKHDRKDWEPQHPVKRTAGRRLQKMRLELFARHPFCQICKLRVSEIRDHIVALAEGGKDVITNIQAVCADCHLKKSQTEAARGRARSR
jgi:5-methylcytosine-specific restriction protein A